MHELGITRNIVAIVGEAAKGRRVQPRDARDRQALRRHDATRSPSASRSSPQGTALEGAALEIREIDGRARCEDCGAEFATETLFAPCPCGSRRLDAVARRRAEHQDRWNSRRRPDVRTLRMRRRGRGDGPQSPDRRASHHGSHSTSTVPSIDHHGMITIERDVTHAMTRPAP